MMKILNVTIIHPFDPYGTKFSGYEIYIKDFIANSPENFNIKLVGARSAAEVPLNEFSQITVDGKAIDFLPLIEEKDENRVKKIPLSLRFTIALYRQKKFIKETTRSNIIQFHRIESALPFYNDQYSHKILFLHRNYFDLLNPYCEIRWKYFPGAYRQLEKKVLSGMDKIILTGKDGFTYYAKYPIPPSSLEYVSQWIDLSKFDTSKINGSKEAICKDLNIDKKSKLIINWGRLAGQKDPLLMLKTFFLVNKILKNTHLLIIGDGQLKQKMTSWAKERNILSNIHFFGVKNRHEIMKLAGASDLFILTSAFETGPISVLEALACGLPVVSTDVGMVRDIIKTDKAGRVISERSPNALADAVVSVLNQNNKVNDFRNMLAEFEKGKVLQKLYGLHEDIG